MRVAARARRLVAAALLASAPSLSHSDALAETRKTTATYKKVQGLELRADVYRSNDDVSRPVVLWIHGGALIGGHREWLDDRVLEWADESGYALVSIDYRLAPESRLAEIVADLEDAFDWISGEGGERFQLDASRLVAGGASAGGYLALVSGYRAEPRPKALLSIYGYGDLIGEWQRTPSQHARHYEVKLSYEDARRPLIGAPVAAPAGESQESRFRFYDHCRQRAIWPLEVSGWDPSEERERFYPFMPIENVNGGYPPTVLIHGTADTDVPYEQSVLMLEALERSNVPRLLLTIPDAEHGLAGGDGDAIDNAYTSAFEFLETYLR